MKKRKGIVSENEHHYLDLLVPTSKKMYDNYVASKLLEVDDLTAKKIKKSLASEFNAKWLRDSKRSILKFYTAQDLEYFILRFS